MATATKDCYHEGKTYIDEQVEKRMNAEDRFQSINERKNESDFDAKFYKKMSRGKYATRWRGISLLKDIFDVVIYQQLIYDVKPKTIIETGTFSGSSALWMADLAKAYGFDTQVYSIDIDLRQAEKLALENENVTIKQGDVYKLEEVFPPEMLKKLPHPWIMTEDCHVNVFGIMEYFRPYMEVGDYFIIDDSNPALPVDIRDSVPYEPWGTEVLDAMTKFLKEYDDQFKVDSFYTDFHGYNATGNWNGFIRKIK